jgi:RNA polymerase sigma-70 factor (ECF subfamily)
MAVEITLQIESWPQTIEEFDHLVEATQDELVHFAAYRLGNREDAEDVVQDVYVLAFRDREKRRNITEVRPYLFRMTGNRCTDFLRARSRRLREKSASECVSGDVSESLAMWLTVNQLPEREAEVIGEPFQSGIYRGYFVPYQIRMRNGYVKSHNLAVRNDNPNGRWMVEGGF